MICASISFPSTKALRLSKEDATRESIVAVSQATQTSHLLIHSPFGREQSPVLGYRSRRASPVKQLI